MADANEATRFAEPCYYKYNDKQVALLDNPVTEFVSRTHYPGVQWQLTFRS